MYCLRNPSARRNFLRLATRRSTITSKRWKSDTTTTSEQGEELLHQRRLIYPAPATTQHTDLASFQSYAKRTGLDSKSTVYVGTHYEYLVAAHLARYGFDLRRIGGARDRGTDLIGTWTIPVATAAAAASAAAAAATSPSLSAPPLKVLIQCKAGVGQRVGPQHIRELEGAFAGAPPGWRTTTSGEGNGVVAVMVCERPATKGVREALAHSKWPMVFVYCEGTATGIGGGAAVRQMLWNKKAEEQPGLDGLGVGMRHVGEETELVLMRKGKMLPFFFLE